MFFSYKICLTYILMGKFCQEAKLNIKILNKAL